MAPVVYGLEAKYHEKISFVFLDIDDPKNTTFKKRLGYKIQPHFFFLDDQGNIQYQWFGYVSIEEFESVLSTLP